MREQRQKGLAAPRKTRQKNQAFTNLIIVVSLLVIAKSCINWRSQDDAVVPQTEAIDALDSFYRQFTDYDLFYTGITQNGRELFINFKIRDEVFLVSALMERQMQRRFWENLCPDTNHPGYRRLDEGYHVSLLYVGWETEKEVLSVC